MNKFDKIFDNFFYPKQRNYLLHWLTVGLVFFVFSEILVRVFNEAYFLELRILSFVFLAGGGIAGNYIRTGFNKAIVLLSEIMEFPDKSFEKWKEGIDEVVFTTKTKWAKLSILAIYMFTISVIVTYGLPFQNTILNTILVISLIPLLIVCAMGAYVLIALISTISQIAHFPTNVPFYLIKHHSIKNLSTFLTKSSLITLTGYSWLILLIWLSPYKLEGIILISVLILGFYPSAMFLWSFSQVHLLLQTIKQTHIQTINSQIQEAVNNLEKKPSTENADLLAKLMEIQKKIEELNDFPIAIGEISTFIVTLGLPIFNVFVAFRDVFNP